VGAGRVKETTQEDSNTSEGKAGRNGGDRGELKRREDIKYTKEEWKEGSWDGMNCGRGKRRGGRKGIRPWNNELTKELKFTWRKW